MKIKNTKNLVFYSRRTKQKMLISGAIFNAVANGRAQSFHYSYQMVGIVDYMNTKFDWWSWLIEDDQKTSQELGRVLYDTVAAKLPNMV